MRVADLQIRQLDIPFKLSFSHAAATRSATDSVLVTARSGKHTGYGEGCPRRYVTGEDAPSVMRFFRQFHKSVLRSVSDLATLQQWGDTHAAAIDSNPAAWCAMELALLDLLAKENGTSVEGLLGLPELAGDFSYTAILGDSDLDSFNRVLDQYAVLGFNDFKLKSSGHAASDKARIGLIGSRVPGARIRIDANNLWRNREDAVAYAEEIAADCFALEEPLAVNDYAGLSAIAEATGLRIILDESFTRLAQFHELAGSPSRWIINIRLSKMGGLLRSLAVAAKAGTMGVKCIVGAQVGETSLLSRAALTLVNHHRDHVIAQEGAFGSYLLAHDIFSPIIMFGGGARLSSQLLASIGGLGFGLINTRVA